MSKRVGFLAFALLAVCLLVNAANIEEVRKEALKKLEQHLNKLLAVNQDVNVLIQKYESNLNVIAGPRKTHAFGIAKSTHEELYKLSVSFGMRAALVNAKPEVVDCVEKTHINAQQLFDEYEEENITEAAHEIESKASNVFGKKLFKWYYAYNNKTDIYHNLHNQVKSDISVSKNETEITTKVALVTKETNTLIDFTYSIIHTFIKDQQELIKKYNVFLDSVRDYCRKTADQTVVKMEKCFPKAFSLFNNGLFN